MEFIIHPRQGIGPVRLGMSRQEIRTILSEPPDTFRRNKFSEVDTDYFVSIGIMADFDADDRCNFITAVSEARPTFQNRPIVGVPHDQCETWFRQLDPGLEVADVGLTSRKLGICLYAPGVDERASSPVECVHVFADGYYD
jgi:hypothetical protein